MAEIRNRRAASRITRGLVVSLTLEVNKVIADIKNRKDGDNLNNWSASSRKELTSAIKIPFRIGPDTLSIVHVPKLALIVASPIVCEYLENKSDATMAKFVHPDISKESMGEISNWLKDVCNSHEMPELPMPENIKDALKLRLVAHTLGMHCYVKHFDAYYAINVGYYDANVQEVIHVVDYTRKDKDGMLFALANRLSYICRYQKVPESLEIVYAELLACENFGRLLAAVNEKEAKAMIKRD